MKKTLYNIWSGSIKRNNKVQNNNIAIWVLTTDLQ